MVRPDSKADGLDGLKNTRLATYRRTPLMDRVYLNTLLEANGQQLDTYFRQIKQFDTAKDAIRAVLNHEFDCVMINTMVYNRHIANRPMP